MLAFVHIEKTAGTSMTRILQRSFGGRFCVAEAWRTGDRCFSAADYRRLRWIYPRLRALSGHWITPWSDLRDEIPDLRFFTFLRDPLERCASHYQHQVQRMGKSMPLAEWIRIGKYRNFQTVKLAGSDDVTEAVRRLGAADFVLVGLAERFDESLVLLRRAVRPEVLHIEYRAENVAADSGIKRELLEDPASRSLLEDANRADLELYRHVRDRIYPRQVEAYGPDLAADVAAFRGANRVPGWDLRTRLAELRRRMLYKPLLLLNRRLEGPQA